MVQLICLYGGMERDHRVREMRLLCSCLLFVILLRGLISEHN